MRFRSLLQVKLWNGDVMERGEWRVSDGPDYKFGTRFDAVSVSSYTSLELSRNDSTDTLMPNKPVEWYLAVGDSGVSLTTEQMGAMIDAYHVMLAETIQLMEEN